MVRSVVPLTIVIVLVALGIVVFWSRTHIGRASSPGTITEYTIPTANSGPAGITTGPDGALWFVERVGNKIGRLTVSGDFTEYPIPTADGSPGNIITGPDGALWFTEFLGKKVFRVTASGAFTKFASPHQAYAITPGPDGALWLAGFGDIGRMNTAGGVTDYTLPSTANSGGYDITTGPDRVLWFTITEQTTITNTVAGARYTGSIGRMTTSGAFTKYTIPTANIRPAGITAGPDGALWFTESQETNVVTRSAAGFTTHYTGGKVGRMTTSGAFTEYAIPTANGAPGGITTGPDGALWFTERKGNKIGRVSTSGAFTEYAIPTPNSDPDGITTGPDGALWFVEFSANKIGRIAPH